MNINVAGQDATSEHLFNKRYALIIGISEHDNPANNLNYAKKDALDVKDALIKNGRFEKENVKVLVNKDATRENIRKGIEGWLKSNSTKNDLVFIFFSGHGTQIPDGDGDEDDGLDECLIPYDFDNSDLSSVITDDIFAYWIRNLSSENILIVFDNCFSGGAARQKGISFPGAKGNVGNDNFSKDIFREVPRKGTSLLAASKADQVSFESNEFENGIFTHFLLKSISIESDNDFNKIIDSKELFYATRQHTLEYSREHFKKEQEPIFVSMIDYDLDIFYLPETKPDELKDKQNKALEYKIESDIQKENDLAKKIIIYKQLYDIAPDNISYNHRIAMLYEWNGEYLKAIEHLKFILSNKNRHIWFSPPVTNTIGELYKKLGEKELAIYYFNEAIKTNPEITSIYDNLSQIYLSQNDTLRAIQNLNKSISVQPYQKKPYLTLFYLQLNMGNLEDAKQIINKGYSMNPNDFETLNAYSSVQKFIEKSTLGDSLYLSLQKESGINKRIEEVSKVDDSMFIINIVNGKELTKQEAHLQKIKNAISEYPYYPEFYKIFIKYVVDNKIDVDLSSYKKRYLNYSILNPDKSFIANYIKQ